MQILFKQSLSQKEKPIQVNEKNVQQVTKSSSMYVIRHFIHYIAMVSLLSAVYHVQYFKIFLTQTAKVRESPSPHQAFPKLSFSHKTPFSPGWNELYSSSELAVKLHTPAYFQGTLQGLVLVGQNSNLDITLTMQRNV